MDKKKTTKIKKIFSAAVFLAAFLLLGIFFIKKDASPRISAREEKIIFLSDENISGKVVTRAKTVEEFLQKQKINLDSKDIVIPEKNQNIFSGLNIMIRRSKKAAINVDGQKIEGDTFSGTAEEFIWEKNITLKDEDIVVPERRTALADGANIKITRVEIKEEIKNQPIDFKEIANEDSKLGWRIKKITQKGEKGNLAITYSVAYHDSKEVSRKVLKKETTKEPVAQIVTQGTYMKLGKANTGQGTWYAWKGGLFAASTTLPRGAFAKVTNTENGKSVVVQINDYGPQGKGRIIDLDKVAFEKIASLGAGVIGVKVEQVLN